MAGTIYERDYLDEHLQNTVDNLNLLYVAFTRAKQRLFVLGRREAPNTRSALIEKVLPQIKLKGSVLEGLENNEAELSFSYGDELHEPYRPHEAHKSYNTHNVFLQPVTPKSITIETFEIKTEFRQSNKSRDFIEDESGQQTTQNGQHIPGKKQQTADGGQQTLSYIKIGSVLHEIFSTIRTTADINHALLQLQNDGVLYDDEVTREKITSMLRKRLEDNRVKDWFSGRWKLYNECNILTLEDGKVKTLRPDRVMTDGQVTHVVDFKFGHPNPDYQTQVRTYMQLLRTMGMPNVKGWLWYVYSNKIEEVKDE